MYGSRMLGNFRDHAVWASPSEDPGIWSSLVAENTCIQAFCLPLGMKRNFHFTHECQKIPPDCLSPYCPEEVLHLSSGSLLRE